MAQNILNQKKSFWIDTNKQLIGMYHVRKQKV